MSKSKNKRVAKEFAARRQQSIANQPRAKQDKPQRKIKLVYHGDSPKVNTGFGVVAREVLSRLQKTGRYEIHSVGINDKGDPNMFPELNDIYHYALPDYANDPYGVDKLPRIIKHVQPDVIFTLNDIFVLDGDHKRGTRDWFLSALRTHAPHTPWVLYFPVDSRPWKLSWANLAFSADKTIVYSHYAEEILKEVHPEFSPIYISHGVSLERFNVIDNAIRTQIRAMLGCNNENFLVGFVSRNQPRKNPAAIIEIFKMANEGYRKCQTCKAIRNLDDPRCEYCGESNEVSVEIPAPLEGKGRCYLHFNLLDNMGIDAAKVINDNKAGNGMIFNPGHSIPYGLPDNEFNQVFNCLDVHLLTTMCEGFGLTIIEGMACGVPTIATRTTAVTELLEQGGGWAVIPSGHYVFDDAANTRKHIIDYERAIEALKVVYEDWKLRDTERWGPETKKRVEKGLAFAKEFTWDKAAEQFDFHIQDAIKNRVRIIDQYSDDPKTTKIMFEKADSAGGVLQTVPAVLRFCEAHYGAEVCYAMPGACIELFEGKLPEKVKLIPIERMSDKNPENRQNIKINMLNFAGPELRYEQGSYPFVDRSRSEIYCLHAGLSPLDCTLVGTWFLTDEEKIKGAAVFAKQVPDRQPNDFVVGLSPLTQQRRLAWGNGRENWEKLKKYLEKMGMKTFMLDSGAAFKDNIAALSMCDLVVTVDGDVLDFLHALDVPTYVLISPYWRVRVKGWEKCKCISRDDLARQGLRDDFSNPHMPSQLIDQIGIGEVFSPVLTYMKAWKEAKKEISNGKEEPMEVAAIVQETE